MPRRLTISEHGVLELLAGIVLMGAPLVLGLGPVALLAGIGAGMLVAGLALSEDLPLSAHMAADTALGLAMLGTGALLAATGHPVAATLLACGAAAVLALNVATRWTR